MEIFKAGVYARISVSESKSNEDSTSIINQKNVINDYCIKNNIEIVKYYVDDGYSGGNFNRPAFKRMLADIDAHIINLVITKDISRLGRDFLGTSNYIYKVFPENNVRYIAILDQYDSYIPSISDDIIPFKTVLNDMYLKDISTKIKSSRHELMRKGYFMGSTVPYGYKRSLKDSRVLEIDNNASFVVKDIFRMSNSGMNASLIARALTKRKIAPPNIYNNRGKINKSSWTSSSINYILRNPVYVGLMRQRRYERVSLKSIKRKLLDEKEWIQISDNHPAIIDEDLFKSVNKKNEIIRHKKYDYLLKGLVKCRDCNKNMFVRKTKSGVIYCCSTYAKNNGKKCSMHYFREDKLNELIKTSLSSFLNKTTFFKILNKIIEEKLMSEDVFKSNSLLEDEKELLVSLYKDKINGIITDNDYLLLRSSIEEEIKEKKYKLNKMKKVKDSLINKMDFIYNKFMNLDDKYIYSSLINKISIDKHKNVYIYYRFYFQ